MATTIRTLNDLSDRLSALHDRIREEWATLPQQRKDAGSNADLLAAIERRKVDLMTADGVRKDAVAAWRLAAAAHSENPEECDRQYAACLKLTADVESIVNYRKGKKADAKDTKVDDTAPKPDSDKEKGKKGDKPAPADDSTDDSKDGKSKEKKDDKPKPADDSDKEKAKDKDMSEMDKVLAAIAKLGEDCAKQHTDLGQRIDALEPRLIKPELAKIINGRTPEQLAAALNGHGVTPQQAAFLEALVARFTPDEFLALLDIRDAGFMDRFRFAFGGNGTPSTPTRGGSHR